MIEVLLTSEESMVISNPKWIGRKATSTVTLGLYLINNGLSRYEHVKRRKRRYLVLERNRRKKKMTERWEYVNI